MTSLLALALAHAPASSAVIPWNWIDAPTKTVYYTPGTSIGVLYIITDLPYDPLDQSVEVVSGTPPAGITWARYGSCASSKLCSAYTGTPTASTVSTVVLRAINGVETRDLTIEFRPAFSISGTAAAAVAGASYSSTFSLAGGTLPSSWNAPTGTLPPGLTFNTSTGILSGTPTTAAVYSFTLSATDSTPTTATKAVSLTVYSELSVTTTTLPATTLGASYSQTLASSGGTTPRTWSISSGSLPAGLSLNTSTGALTGTATSAGTSNFTAQVACCSTATASQALSIVVNPAPSITTTTLPATSPGATYSQTLGVADGTGPFTWSVSAGALPAGLSLSAAGVISGTPTATGSSSFTARVQDARGIAATQSLSILVQNLLSITTTTLPPLTVGQNVSTALVASSGSTPYAWSITAGALPAGITLNPVTGALTGTPTTAATSSFTVKVTDSNSQESTANLTWTVNAAPSITTTTLPPTTVSATYAQTLAATGGTGALTWSISSGTLSAGLSLNAATGAITGTAAAAASASITVRATDTNNVYASQAFTLTVNAQPAITTTSLPSAAATHAYSQTLSATGGTGTLTWSLTAGTLPPGLSLSAAGLLSGTPTTTGTFPLTVQAQDTLTIAATQPLSLLVRSLPAITTTTLPALTATQTVSNTLAATSGATPYTWSVTSGALPAGITLNASTGALTGAPTAAGQATFAVKVTDAANLDATANLTWLVNAAPSITTTTLNPTTVTAAYSATLAATGGTGALTWSVASGTLPAGLSLNPTTGALTGTPASAGPATFTVHATDTNSVNASQALSLTVNPLPAINTAALPDAVLTNPYSQQLSAQGGTGALSWTISSGALPVGLNLSASGLITGSPTTPGVYNLTLRVQDTLAIAATQTLSLRVLTMPVITTTTLPSATVGRSLSASLAATNGTPPYTWSIINGPLPSGLSLNSGAGTLTGTPAAPGTFAFTAKVTDSANQEATAALSWTVNSALSITTTTISETTLTRPIPTTILAATGGTGTRTWSATGLPSGLTLNSSGVLSGTPTAVAGTPVEFKVTDANGATATASLTVTVNSLPAITTASLPFGVLASTYAHTLASAGGTGGRTWSTASGALPRGLSLSPTGALSGTPAEPGSFQFTLQISDSLGVTATAPFSLQIAELPVIVTSTLADLTAGQSATFTLSAAKGAAPYQWSVADGALPAGLQLSPATGIITGTATSTGTAAFTIKLKDGRGLEATRAFTWKTNTALSISAPSVPALVAGRPLPPLSIGRGGGTAPFTFYCHGLPAGLQMDSSTGETSGTPTSTGTFEVNFSVRDANGVTATANATWKVLSGLTINSTSFNPLTAGAAASRTISISGGAAPYQWFIVVGAPPPGMIVSATDGTLSGIPGRAGAYEFTLRVQDVYHAEALQTFTLQVNPELAIVASNPPPMTAGRSVRHGFSVTGGTAPIQWSVASGTLPPGLSLNAQGELAGAATAPGSFPFTLRARDANLAEALRVVNLQVSPADELRLSPAELCFEAFAGGADPAPEQVTVSSTPSNYAVRISSSAPWLTAALTAAQTPLVLNVSARPGELAAGAYSAQIIVEGPQTRSIAVVLNLTQPPAPKLTANPAALSLSARAGAPKQQALLRLLSTTASPVWRASSESPWLTLSPAEGTFDTAFGGTLTATADASALAPGSHSAKILVQQGETTLEVPLTFTVEEDYSFELSYTALNFELKTDATAEPQPLMVLNRGTAPLDWIAQASEPWIRLEKLSGVADPVSPVLVRLEAGDLAPGSYQGRITVQPPSGVGSHSADVRLTILTRDPPPAASPAGLLFVALPGLAVEPQFIRLTNPGSEPVSFTAAASPTESSAWLALGQTSGSIAGGASLDLAVPVMPGSLAPGMYRAQVAVEFSDGTVRVITLALRVVAANCEGGAPELSWVRLGEHFSVIAGQPAALAIKVTDSCGLPISDGAGLVTFSREGEPALPLIPGPDGLWTATWQPQEAAPSISLHVLIQSEGGLFGALAATGWVAAPAP